MSVFWNMFLAGLGLGFAVFFVALGGLGGWLVWAFVRGWVERQH